jgi:hypothetical protein
MVHHASLSAAFLTLNSKMPLFCAGCQVFKRWTNKAEVEERAPSLAVLPSLRRCILQ